MIWVVTYSVGRVASVIATEQTDDLPPAGYKDTVDLDNLAVPTPKSLT